MARSMTGFGRGQVILPDSKCSIEIKTVNSKYCDVSIRLPRILNCFENNIREIITKSIGRGKIDVYVTYEDNKENSKSVTVDLPLVKAYQHAFEEIAKSIGSEEKIYASQISRMNDIFSVQVLALDEEETWNMISETLNIAVKSLCEMKEKEGKALVTDILDKCELLENLRLQVLDRSPLVVTQYKDRLAQRITDLAGDLAKQLIDEQRLALEVAIFADKCAVDEEIVRLHSHITQLKSTLNEKQSVGKKLDFILQEMNREINTIGSKANDIFITKCVVEMKTTLEKIREQIQNIE